MREMIPYVTVQNPPTSPLLRVAGDMLRESLVLVQDNNPSFATVPYICFVAMESIYTASRYHCENHLNRKWIFDTLPARVLGDVISRKCTLVLDLCNEGSIFEKCSFDDIFFWIESNRIHPEQVILLCQNRAIPTVVQRAYPDKRKFFFANYDYFIKQIADQFSEQSTSPSAGGKLEEEVLFEAVLSKKDRTFLCLNSAPRPHRIVLLAMLRHHGLLDDALFSWHGGQLSGKESAFNARQLDNIASLLDPAGRLAADIEYFKDLTPVVVDSLEKGGNSLSGTIDANAYRRTVYSVVSETEFSKGEMHRVTEKSIKAFCMGHPVVIFGNPNSLSLVKSLGFDTFDELIDPLYDSIPEQKERFDAIEENVLRMAQRFQQDPGLVDGRTAEVAKSNIAYAFSGFKKNYESVFDRRLESLFRECLNSSQVL